MTSVIQVQVPSYNKRRSVYPFFQVFDGDNENIVNTPV